MIHPISKEVRERQLQRSRNYRKEQKEAGRTPVVTFLDHTTRERLKTLAPDFKWSSQLPALVKQVVEVFLALVPLLVKFPELERLIKDASSDPQPVSDSSPRIKPIPKSPKPSIVSRTVRVESFSELILWVQQLDRACELEGKRLRQRKVRSARKRDAPSPPSKDRRKPTCRDYYESVAAEVQLKAKQGESLDTLKASYEINLRKYACLMEKDLNLIHAELVALGAVPRQIGGNWPPPRNPKG